MVFHVLNRGVGRQRLLSRPSDYEAFEDVVEESLEKIPMRICSYCVTGAIQLICDQEFPLLIWTMERGIFVPPPINHKL